MVDEIIEKEDAFLPLGDFEEQKVDLKKDFIDVLKMVAPGTKLRSGLDDLLRARMGALIVLDTGSMDNLIEGGFKINAQFTSQKLVELAKMDGAIVLSMDVKKILSANALLVPDASLHTKETGTRHKAASRTAQQANTIAIAVSERKNKISIYYGSIDYQLEASSEILRRASETLQILEKQKEVFTELLDNLNNLELRRIANIKDVCAVLQRIEIIKKISSIVERYLVELGKEGFIVRMRLKELTSNISGEEELILKDYFGSAAGYSLELLEKLDFDFLLEPLNISRLLFEELHDKSISPKGWRLLGKTNLIERHVDLLVGNFKDLNAILKAKDKELLGLLEGEAMVAFFHEEIYNLMAKVNLGRKI